MKFKFKLLAISLFGIFAINAKIVESEDLADISRKYISSDNPLILFDVDKTLIKYSKPISNRIEEMYKSFPDLKSDKFKLKWFLFEPTQPGIKNIMEELQKKYKILALTRCTSLKPFYKFFQMSELGVDFGKSYPEYNFIDLSGSNGKAFYKDGLILCGKIDKGEVLANFLQTTGLSFSEVIFVDNDIKNLQDVEKAMKPLKIPYTGIHYTRVKKQG